jgi:transposase-like protein
LLYDAAIQNWERRTSVVSKNKRKKLKGKRAAFSKEQKLALVKGCQTSPFTVAQYAKENKVAESTLYKWAEVSGVSLKPTGKKNQKRKESEEEKHLAELGRLEMKLQGVKPETQTLEKSEGIYKKTFKRFAIWISGKDSS